MSRDCFAGHLFFKKLLSLHQITEHERKDIVVRYVLLFVNDRG